jgi:hypothetical protein
VIASVKFRRLLLRGIYWDAQDDSLTLANALKAACRARLTETQNGWTLAGTSGNGTAVSFSVPVGNFSPEAVASACEDLYTRYEEASAELTAEGDASITDSEIFTRMMRLLVARNEVSHDFSQLADRGVCA